MRGPQKIRFFGKDADLLFLSLLGGLFVLDLPFFLDYTIPLHDTFTFSQFFYFFYNELLQNSSLPWWMPFGTFGFQSNFYFMAEPPAYHLLQSLGWLFKVKNALTLFKAAMFLEQTMLLIGTYLLARNLFRHKITIAFVCITVMGSMAIITQITWNFHFYYLLPLLIYLLLNFLKAFKLQYLFLAGIVFVLSSLPGGAPYMAVVVAMEAAIILLVWLVANFNRASGSRAYSRNDVMLSLLSLALLALLSASYYGFMNESLIQSKISLAGRDSVTGAVSLDTFLNYGGDIGLIKFTDLISPLIRFKVLLRSVQAFDITLFMGIIPLFYLFMSLKSYRNPAWLAFAITVIFLGAVSVGGTGIIARLLYEYFPPVRLYRHIGFVVSSFKVLLPLMAGFGLERFLDRIERAGPTREAEKSIARHKLFIAALLLSGSLSFTASIQDTISHSAYTFAVTAILALGVALLCGLLFLRRRLKPVAHFHLFLIACLCFELLSYQTSLNWHFHRLSEPMRPFFEDVYVANDYGFQNERTTIPSSKRANKTFLLEKATTTKYTSAYNFMQWDPCVPAFRIEMINSGVLAFFSARGGELSDNKLRLPEDPYLTRSIGCDSSKIRLTNNVIFAKDRSEAFDILREIPDNDEVIVLTDFSEGDRTSRRKDLAEPAGDMELTDFKANALELKASLPQSAWLYYADAWHPGWKAYVNGKPTPIAKANLGFKAVRLEGGKSDLSFVFNPGRARIYGIIIFILGATFAGVLLVLAILTIFRKGY
jgi:hypothetical protein